jgi:hypothetical protein
VAPAIADEDGNLVPVLVLCLTAGLIKRWRSAWMGIIVHSTQSVFLGAVTLALVLA